MTDCICFWDRLDQIFWIKSHLLRPAVLSARLDGSEEKEIIAGDLSDPGNEILHT